MSIRKRLGSFFLLILALVTAMGAAMYAGRPIIVGAFQQSLGAMNDLNAIRELRSNLNSQRLAISRYLLVDDAKELINFDESSRLIKKTFDTLEGRFTKRQPAWFIELSQRYNDTYSLAARVATDYKKGQSNVAREDFVTKLTPKLKDLNDRVEALEGEKSREANETFLTIRSLMEKTGSGILLVFFSAVLIGLVLFRSLYHAVVSPLEVLRKGTEEFGRGQWDFRINSTGSVEFDALAKSFNTMAENVKQLQAQAVHLDRMSAVGQLAGGVAHEINNPLTAVLGQAQILLAKLDESDPSWASLKKIENAGLRCKKIVRGLLDFSRPSQAAFEAIDANEVVRATLDLCEADLKKARVTVDRRLSNVIPKIQANPSELQQVLLNLINNAIQAMPRGGTLTLETRSHKNALKILDRRKGAPPRVLEGPWVEVRVTDTGIGIAEEHLNRIFEPFFTTKEIGKGTGLGLAVSMGIVQKHGGDLRVESQGLNHGATFYVTLPLKVSANGSALSSARASGLVP
jgi:signal transduction histidine kinase